MDPHHVTSIRGRVDAAPVEDDISQEIGAVLHALIIVMLGLVAALMVASTLTTLMT